VDGCGKRLYVPGIVAGIQVSNVVDHSKQYIHIVPVTKAREDNEDAGTFVLCS
jgi:hypothetical protein